MPYRTPAQITPPPTGLGVDFWNEPNSYLESRALQAADSAVVSGLKKLVASWYKETRTKYPKEYHVLLHDISEATIGSGTYLKVTGDAKYLLGVLVSTARIDGLLTVETELFDLAGGTDRKLMVSYEREAASRWIMSEPQILHVVEAAFTTAASKLDKALLQRFEESPAGVMKAIYFRSIAQGDVLPYDDTRLVQNLYKVFYE